MRLVIAARRSDLARLQAQQVAAVLKKNNPKTEIEFRFKASLGDLDQDSALVTMGNKGVFTQDFHADLVNGTCDLVVHSWKDLPVEPVPGTRVVATLERADRRDVLLLRQDVDVFGGQERIRILSSSPRRAYNLAAFLPKVWPKIGAKFIFTNVRGNIPTRVKKLMQGEGEALVVAKAALDRLLQTDNQEFSETRQILRQALEKCRWMVLPLSQNPCAPAQGGLAIEIHEQRLDLIKILAELNHQPSFVAIERERQILAQYGGGCHQKIGVSIESKPYGTWLSLRGQTDQGLLLNKNFLEKTKDSILANSIDEIFPLDPIMGQWFERVPLPKEEWWTALERAQALWVARANALPATYQPTAQQLVWTAGVSSWQALARRGIWVNGCADNLGEQESEFVEHLIGQNPKWLRLTHQQAAKGTPDALATYKIQSRKNPPKIKNQKHFFWLSGSAFLRALELFPAAIKAGHHACGPGKTAKVIGQALQREPLIFLSWQDWRSAVLPEVGACGK